MVATARSPTASLPDRRVVAAALGAVQILAWGSTFYLLAVLAPSIVRETGWGYEWVMSGVSVGLLIAGIVSPRVGRAIADHGPRPILALGAMLSAAGLLGLGLTQSFAWYVAAWVLLGTGMGAGLYDAAFAALGSIYGAEARAPISWVTLLGGFASTVCWPLSAFLSAQLGWRATCFVYAGIYAGMALPLLLVVLPRRAGAGDNPAPAVRSAAPLRLRRDELAAFVVLAAALTVVFAILSIVGANFLTLLQARGVSLGEAVALGMIIGPAQVGARLVETMFGSRYDPIWTMLASAAAVALSMVLFAIGAPLFAAAVAFYAAGTGIASIARGTVPLALFGPERYPVIVGRLGLPILAAMALAPFVGAVAFQHGGADATFALLDALTGANVLLVLLLWGLSRKRPAADSP
jgi:MFS family permease